MKPKNIIVGNALKIYLGIVSFFLVMYLFGLENITNLRFFNILFVLWGVNSAIKSNLFKNKDSNYISNLLIGFLTAFVAVIMVTFSLVLYLDRFNPEFIEVVGQSLMWGKELTVGMVAFTILFEGIASSAISSFIIMQYWKNYKMGHI